MSKLFDDSSLAMIPSAVKDGKLYSIRPTDGDGDFTFSRGSNLAATRVDVNGLIEKGRENQILHSNNFSTGWTTNDASLTSGQSGYDGSNNAWKLVGNTNASRHNLLQSFSITGINTLSVYVKASGHNYVQLASASSIHQYANFDLSDGSVGSVGSSFVDAKATSVGNGWYRLSVVNPINTMVSCYISLISSNTAGWLESWTMSNSTDGVFLQHFQFEQGLVATDYIETGASTAQAGILEDLPRLDYGASCPSLLLEPQRSNLIGNSEYFGAWNNVTYPVTITSNSATSPDGNTNAALITPTSGNSRHATRDTNVAAVSGTTYTLSAFFKKAGSRYVVLGDSGDSLWHLVTADLNNGTITDEENATGTIEPYENDWYRVTCTFTRTNAVTIQTFLGASPTDTNTAAPSFDDTSLTAYIYGFQVEAESYPTSYIPTYGSAVTRSQDLTTADTSSFYTDSSSGTLFTELSFPLAADGNYNGWFFWNGSGYNRIVLQRRGDSGRGQIEVRINNTTQASIISSSVITLEDNHKMLVRWDGNVFTFFIDGVNIGSDTSNDVYSGTDLNELASRPTYNAANIKQILLFPTALTDSECIALTTL